MGLPVHDQRIDATSDVVDRCVARDAYIAGLGIDLHLAGGAAVGEYRFVHLVVGHHRDAVLQVGRQIMIGRVLRELEEIEGEIAVARAETAVGEFDLIRIGVEHHRGDLLAPGDQIGKGLRKHGGGVAHGASGMRAAAHLHHVGVAENDAHALDRQPHEVRHHLREARFVALAARLRADDDVDIAFRPHRDARLLVRRSDGGLDVIGEPAAEQLAARFGLAAALLEARPVGELHRPVHVLLVVAAVVVHADGIAVRHRVGLDQVHAAQCDPIDAELACGEVDEPLDRERHLRSAGAAIGLGRHGVGVDRHGPQRRRWDGVGAGDQARTLRERGERHAARAHIADVGRAHRQELSILAQGELDLHDEVAPLVIAEEGLRAGRRILDRTAKLARGPQDQPELDEDTVAGAEIAADVVGQHPQLVGGNAEHARELALLAHRAAAAGVQRVAAAGRVVLTQRRARLKGHAGHAIDVEVPRHDVVGAGEGPLRRLAIAEQRIHGRVVG